METTLPSMVILFAAQLTGITIFICLWTVNEIRKEFSSVSALPSTTLRNDPFFLDDEITEDGVISIGEITDAYKH